MDNKFTTIILTGVLFAISTKWSIVILAAIGFLMSLLWFWQFVVREKFGAIVSFVLSVFVVAVNFQSPNIATNILAVVIPCLTMATFYKEKKATHKRIRQSIGELGSATK